MINAAGSTATHDADVDTTGLTTASKQLTTMDDRVSEAQQADNHFIPL